MTSQFLSRLSRIGRSRSRDRGSPDRSTSPRREPTSNEKYVTDELVDEERLGRFDRGEWCLIKQWEEYHGKRGRYQVIGKLGYGSVSTVWLCRDLQNRRWVALKVFNVGTIQASNELIICKRLNALRTKHPGKQRVRTVLDHFKQDAALPQDSQAPQSLYGQLQNVSYAEKRHFHQFAVYEPLGISLEELRRRENGKVPSRTLKPFLRDALLALDFLHKKARLIHTDVSEKNLLLSYRDDSAFTLFTQEEMIQPSDRKFKGNHVLYKSRSLEWSSEQADRLMLVDQGSAKFLEEGQEKTTGEAQAAPYRAPEMILGTPWDQKIDVWSFGMVVWYLYTGLRLFGHVPGDRAASRKPHFWKMVSLMGSPSPKFVAQSTESDIRNKLGLDDQATHIEDSSALHSSEEQEEQEQEQKEEQAQAVEEDWEWEGMTDLQKELKNEIGDRLEDEHVVEKQQFVMFMEQIMTWEPEDRASARQLLNHPWLSEPYKPDNRA